MLIRNVLIENIRSIRSAEWSVSEGQAKGWHVILGDNGSGKSSFLRSIALALTGPKDAIGLRQPWEEWLNRNAAAGRIDLQISWNEQSDGFTGQGKTPAQDRLLNVGVAFDSQQTSPPVHLKESGAAVKPSPDRHVWSSGQGWFCASYGPFRRFSGGDLRDEKLFYSMPRLARHLSLFDERIALTECLEWLRNLKFRQLENDSEGKLLDRLTQFVNQSGFLPAGAQLQDVTSRGVMFRDANGVEVVVAELSDGYRSILSMTFELIRQLALAFGPEQLFGDSDGTRILPEGVVIIDEIDAHLHPTWQRTIGRWFTEHFPNMQFIVSTHSPLVCQSAERGSIFLLPRAGSGGTGRMLAGDELNRLIYGNVLDAYGTEAFGGEAAATRSPESQELHQRLAQLNNKEIIKGLTDDERTEQSDLRAILPSAAAKLE